MPIKEEVTQVVKVDEEEKMSRFTDYEHFRFVEGCEKFGKDYAKIAKHIGTRNAKAV